MNERKNSRFGSTWTCPSERSRYRPGETVHSQAAIWSEPVSQVKRSERCLGSAIRFPSKSRVTCATNASRLILYPIFTDFSQAMEIYCIFIFNRLSSRWIDISRFSPYYTACWEKFLSAPRCRGVDEDLLSNRANKRRTIASKWMREEICYDADGSSRPCSIPLIGFICIKSGFCADGVR